MKVSKQDDDSYLIASGEGSSYEEYVLRIEKNKEKLQFNLQLKPLEDDSVALDFESSFTYGALIDIDRRFRGFDVLEKISSYIKAMIQEEKFEIQKEEDDQISLCLKDYCEHITIPIKKKEDEFGLDSGRLSQKLQKIESIKSNLLNENKILKEKISEYENGKNGFERFLIAFKALFNKHMKEMKGMIDQTALETEAFEQIDEDEYQPSSQRENKFIDKKEYLIGSALNSKRSLLQIPKEEDVYDLNYLIDLQPIKTIKNHSSYVSSICLTADERLASCSYDKTIKIFNLQNYQCDLTLQGHSYVVSYISLLSNGCLISGSWDYSIKIWEINGSEYKCLYTLTEHKSNINQVKELSDGRICSCSYDKTLLIWKNSPPYDCIASLKGHKNGVYGFVELSNKKYIVSCSSPGAQIRFWNNKDYNCENEITGVDCSTEGSNCIIEISDNRLVVGGTNKITVIDHTKFEVEKEIRITNTIGMIRFIIELSNGIVLCGGGPEYSGDIAEVDINNSEVISVREKANNRCINSLLLLDDGRLVSCSNDNFIKVWK